MNKDKKLEKLTALFSIEEKEDFPCDTQDDVYESLRKIEDESLFLEEQTKKLEALLAVKTIPFAGNKHDADILECPCCGTENLHPTNTISGIDDSIRSEYANYIQTNFWCEHCPNIVGLRLRFHKGLTCMTWQINDESTKP